MNCSKSKNERFWEKVMPVPWSGCWVWIAACNKGGYGSFDHQTAHRYSYEMHKGPVPSGLVLDHLCRVKCCVNPDHLEPVTQKENVKRGTLAEAQSARGSAVTHCPQGHPYSGANLYVGAHGRMCRTCHREKSRKRYHAQRATMAGLGS